MLGGVTEGSGFVQLLGEDEGRGEFIHEATKTTKAHEEERLRRKRRRLSGPVGAARHHVGRRPTSPTGLAETATLFSAPQRSLR
jgi:hypothetical protein